MKTLSVIIPSFERGEILLDTIAMLLSQAVKAQEILVVDQTQYAPKDPVLKALTAAQTSGDIAFHRRKIASIPMAMNYGLLHASSDYVLFLDDDIRVDTNFIKNRIESLDHYSARALVGQVLQPGEHSIDPSVDYNPDSGLLRDLGFEFSSNKVARIANCMAGNLCLHRQTAIDAGGFDENFSGAAFRFETEFCRRFIDYTGELFLFEPSSSIDHLRANSGGTRRVANHLRSASPAHSCGDYYFALRGESGWARVSYIFRRFSNSIVAKFYLTKPWYIPVRLVAEFRGLMKAWRLYRNGPKFLTQVD